MVLENAQVICLMGTGVGILLWGFGKWFESWGSFMVSIAQVRDFDFSYKERKERREAAEKGLSDLGKRIAP